jgi:hypothetical protein
MCFAAGIVLLSTFLLDAQSSGDQSKAQEDFAMAVAKAHARTSLFAAGSTPVSIEATAVSSLALRGTGKGTYKNQWIDAQHWQRVLDFPDFKQSEMRNDSGHSWIERSNDAMPLRITQLLRYIVIHVPNSTGAAAYVVSESTAAGENGEPLTCYSATQPPYADGFSRSFRWCFDTVSGVLVSEDMPLNLHIVYGNYIAFQGKQEFTHVNIKAGGFPVLDMEIQYASLDPHAQDGLVPASTMHRSGSAASAPNPEEWGKSTVEYRDNPPLPPGTPDAARNSPAQVLFQIAADNKVLDASLEDAPTQAMGEAALQAARRFTFTPLTLDGKAVGNRFYYSIWFQTETGIASPPPLGGAPAHAGPGGSARSNPASQLSPGGVYRDEDLSFSFGYPAGFDLIPRGQLEEDHRRASQKSHPVGLEPHVECNTLLFKAQRLHPGERTPEVVSMTDLDPSCIFGMLTSKDLETSAVGAAHSIVDRWIDGYVAKPKRYAVNNRTFIVVSASGIPRGTVTEPLNVIVVLTRIREHLVGWTVLGPNDNLAQTLSACTLQVGEERESPLLPPSKQP